MKKRTQCNCDCHKYNSAKHIMACCAIDTETDSVQECLLNNEHGEHLWWYTSYGGGHMLSYVTEIDFRVEKNLKLHRCPGKKAVMSNESPKPEDFRIGLPANRRERQDALESLIMERVNAMRQEKYKDAVMKHIKEEFDTLDKEMNDDA